MYCKDRTFNDDDDNNNDDNDDKCKNNDNNMNNNNRKKKNGNDTKRRNLRWLTISSPYPKLSPTRSFKWPGRSRVLVGWLVACLTSQQHASVSQGRICSDNFTCCHTEIEVADPTFHSHSVTVN